jgi:hypothetical protein
MPLRYLLLTWTDTGLDRAADANQRFFTICRFAEQQVVFVG